MALQNDVLCELSTPDIIKLSEFYKDYQDEAPHIFSYLRTALRWREIAPEKTYIQIFAPQGQWGSDGTFVSIGHFSWKMLIVYTLDSNCERLYHALANTNRFDYQQDTLLYYAVHEKHISAIDKAMNARGLTKAIHDETDMWRLKQADGLLKTASVSDEFVLARLQSQDSFVVNDNWPHKSDDSEGYVKILIEMSGGYGLYTKDDNKLVAWVLKTHIGQLGLLQVLDAYKRKGLAKAVTNILTKEIAEDEFDIIGTVLTTNVASQTLFTQLGFEKLYLCTFMAYK